MNPDSPQNYQEHHYIMHLKTMKHCQTELSVPTGKKPKQNKIPLDSNEHAAFVVLGEIIQNVD